MSVLHAHNRRAGNCIGLLSNSALLLPTDNKLCHLSKPLDPLRLVTTAPISFFHGWRENFAVEVSDPCFSSQTSSTFDNWASISSDELPCHTR